MSRLAVYVAGNPRLHRDQLRQFMDWVIDHPHDFYLTHDWLNDMEGNPPNYKDTYEKVLDRRRIAMRDLEGVAECDVLVLFDAEQGWGLYTEFGAALAAGKKVIVINPVYMQVFYYHPNVVTILDTEAEGLGLMQRAKVHLLHLAGVTS